MGRTLRQVRVSFPFLTAQIYWKRCQLVAAEFDVSVMETFVVLNKVKLKITMPRKYKL